MTQRTALTRHNAVEVMWPYDGPHDADSVTTAAAALADLVRHLNNATRSGGRGALHDPSTVDRVVQSLASTTHGMTQLADQIAATLDGFGTDPDLFDDRHGPTTPGEAEADRDPQETATSAAIAMENARHQVADLYTALAAVGQHTTHLGRYA